MELLALSASSDVGRFGRILVAVTALMGSLAYGCTEPTGPSEDTTGAETAADGDVSPDTPSRTTDLQVDGVSAPATARFDEWGVLHVECETNMDCYRVQGYFHARHRFFEMDLIRRRTLGEMTRVFGRQGLDSDEKFRHFLTTAEGEPLEDVFYAGVGARAKEMFRAYAAGVNAWLSDWRNEENGATLTEEYEFPLVDKDAIRDWTPRDSVALYLQLAYRLGQKSEDDLFRGRLAAEFPAGTATDLLTPKPGVTSNILQASGVAPMDALEGRLEGGSGAVERMRRRGRELRPAAPTLGEAHRELTEPPTDRPVLGSGPG